MSTYLLAIGINHYTDRAFRALSCCENDASEIHALFKRNLELGDRASKLVGAVSIADVKNELRRIGQQIRNGDTFILFFAGHGYQHPKREDQFLLFPEAEARLVNKGYLDGMLSLSALCELTEHWAGVARVFILDACRSWLPGRDASGARFDNEAALAYIASRDPAFGPDNAKPTDYLNAPGGALPPVILNATRNGQEAKELEDRQRGVLALALEQALESQHKSGEVIWLGEQMLTDVNQRMNTLLQHGRLGVEQTPFLTPPSARVLLFKPQQIAEAPPNDDDETEWAIAVAENSVEAYKAYARRRPPGKYRDDAIKKISSLSTTSSDTLRPELPVVNLSEKPYSDAIKDEKNTQKTKDLNQERISGIRQQFNKGFWIKNNPATQNCEPKEAAENTTSQNHNANLIFNAISKKMFALTFSSLLGFATTYLTFPVYLRLTKPVGSEYGLAYYYFMDFTVLFTVLILTMLLVFESKSRRAIEKTNGVSESLLTAMKYTPVYSIPIILLVFFDNHGRPHASLLFAYLTLSTTTALVFILTCKLKAPEISKKQNTAINTAIATLLLSLIFFNLFFAPTAIAPMSNSKM